MSGLSADAERMIDSCIPVPLLSVHNAHAGGLRGGHDQGRGWPQALSTQVVGLLFIALGIGERIRHAGELQHPLHRA
ncbi:MAG: hypothetical protein NVSMB48_04690 [Marmoricola sp.]